jgi:hypothetical protein
MYFEAVVTIPSQSRHLIDSIAIDHNFVHDLGDGCLDNLI